MFRFGATFCFLSLILCSVGCRICAPPSDYQLSAYIERPYDYRGSHPQYRAGSIFGGWGGSYQMFGEADYAGEFVDYYSNAGNYGVTTPIMTLRHTPGTGTFETQPRIEHVPIAVPQRSPEEEGFFTAPRVRDIDMEPNSTVPPLKDLINRQRGGLMQPSMPITPPARPRIAPLPEEMQIDVIPFSPSDAVPDGTRPSSNVPNGEPATLPHTFPTIMETDPPITLEELQRLDPTIRDVQIISVEDAVPGTVIR